MTINTCGNYNDKERHIIWQYKYLGLKPEKLSKKYRIMLKGTYLSISWNEMLYADSYSRNPEDFVWGNIAVIIIVVAIIYSLRGKKYECL